MWTSVIHSLSLSLTHTDRLTHTSVSFESTVCTAPVSLGMDQFNFKEKRLYINGNLRKDSVILHCVNSQEDMGISLKVGAVTNLIKDQKCKPWFRAKSGVS